MFDYNPIKMPNLQHQSIIIEDIETLFVLVDDTVVIEKQRGRIAMISKTEVITLVRYSLASQSKS